ncbi:MAG TPA: heme exporter protein CcmD [Pyrinomonadaceae bacterium]|jgi:heme exporter protein D
MNWTEFFSMGGYGFYVWGSYLITAILIGGEVFLLMRRKKNLLKQNRGIHSLEGK